MIGFWETAERGGDSSGAGAPPKRSLLPRAPSFALPGALE